MSDNELSSRFINAYNELSEYMEAYLHLREHRSHVQMLGIMSKKNHTIKSNYDELRTFANLRNIIVHDSTSRYNPIANPHMEAVQRYEQILSEITNPDTAYSAATKSNNLIFAHPNMRLIECITNMHNKNFSYMPVIKDNRLIGILSGDSIFTYMRKNQTTTIHKDFRVADLGDSIVEHIDERYCYVKKDTPLNDVVEMYSNDIEDDKRLAAVFVTTTGNIKGKILGMISAWNLIDYMGRED